MKNRTGENMSLIVDIKKNLDQFPLDVSFTAEREITSLLGSSGCGKSMTLKCIAGIEKPDEGHIEVGGRVLFDSRKGINLPPQRRRVGYLFQNYALFPNMTAAKNIACGIPKGTPRNLRIQKTAEVMELLQISSLADRKPAFLSGGEQQRTALARILVSEPDVLLLDEPFSALDGYLRDRLKVGLRDLLLDFGKEVLMVTHSRDEAYNMSSRIGVMNKGKILVMKPVKEVFADPESVPAAIVTGCKNIAKARKSGPREVYVPEWGIFLQTEKEIRDDLCAVGIRAHYFSPASRNNRCRVQFAGEMEEPFETIIQFRYEHQDPDSPAIWWRLPKDKKPAVFPKEVGIAPVNVLPLYGE